MISIEKLKESFMKYTSTFDIKNENIKRKIHHSIRVMEISKQLAEKVFSNEEDVKLATLIGLLHDVGRFEQYTKYKTFSDMKSIDHGNLCAEILFERNRIRDFIEEEQYDKIIKKAIEQHNKYSLDKENLSNNDIIFCEIIRDADKLDILYECSEIFWKNQESKIEKEIATKQIVEKFKKQELIDKKNIKTQVDKIISFIAFIYDINFKESFKILKEKNFINKMMNRFQFEDRQTKIQMEEIREYANKYIEEKIK